jgi:hypothetical protein
MITKKSLMLLNGCAALAAFAVSADPLTQKLVGQQIRPLPGELGFRVYEQQWQPLNPTQNSVKLTSNQPDALSSKINQEWGLFTTRAQGVENDALNGQQVQAGVNLYNVATTIGAVQSVRMLLTPADAAPFPNALIPTPTQPVLLIQSALSNVTANTTSPVTTRGTDPQFEVTFNLSAYVQMNIGPGVSTIAVQKAIIVVSDPQVYPMNTSAQLGEIYGDLTTFFGQTSLQDQLTQNLSNKSSDITGFVAPGIALAAAAAVGNLPSNEMVKGAFADANGLSLVLAPVPLSPNASGQMDGQLNVSVNSTPSGATPAGATCSNSFTVAAQVQVVPPLVTGLNPATFGNPNDPSLLRALSTSVSGGTIGNTGSGWSCDFVVNGLASGFANLVSFPSGLKSNGSLPNAGTVLTVVLQNCSDPIDIPSSGVVRCNLTGTQTYTANSGVGVVKGAAAKGFINPVDPGPGQQTSTAATPSSWGTRATSMSPNWGTPAATTTPLQQRAGSTLQNSPTPQSQTPLATPSSLRQH